MKVCDYGASIFHFAVQPFEAPIAAAVNNVRSNKRTLHLGLKFVCVRVEFGERFRWAVH